MWMSIGVMTLFVNFQLLGELFRTFAKTQSGVNDLDSDLYPHCLRWQNTSNERKSVSVSFVKR